jgi:hypothetical protein
MVGLNSILRDAWHTSQSAEDKWEKIQALSLAKEYYAMKLDLLTNAGVVDDAIRFVSQKEKTKNNDSLVTSATTSSATVQSNHVF